jgi:ankyrin repeat protein
MAADTEFTQEEANQFIIDCHADLETVKQKIAEKPGLAHAYNPETDESALGAASHMGRKDIAEFLLGSGAELDIAAAAMLGRREAAQALLEKDSSLATSGGAHGIPIAFHAALGGDVEIAQLLLDNGAGEALKGALLGAVHMNRVEMARWLLDPEAMPDAKAVEGRTALQMAEERGFGEIAAMLR